MKIHIVQPAVPKYRVTFIEKIMTIYPIKVYATKSDFLGVHTVLNSKKLILSSGFINLLNQVYWHKDLPLFSPYKKDDIVLINGNPRILNYMFLFLFLRVRGIKTVWWGHGFSAGSFGWLAKIRIKLMKLATAVLLYTDKEKEKLSIANCHALNNGLDSSEIKKCIKKVTITREINPLEFNLVFVGRITEKANFDLLLKAMSLANPNVHLNVIGSGDKIDYYKATADELEISDKVHWHGALFDEMEIAKVMLSSQAFIYTGSVGLSLIHAFNYGLPAIIHSNEKYHMPEFSAFENGVNGISFEQNNINDLITKINEISSLDDSEYIMMSRNSFKTVAESYNVDDMVFRFTNMIEELYK
jgi:glycosyltransferase involved in cell wall biosynthesis